MNIEEKGEISLNDQRPSIGFHQSVSVAAMAEAGQPADGRRRRPAITARLSRMQCAAAARAPRPAITARLSRMQCTAAARAPQAGGYRIQCSGMRREIELKK